MSIKTSERTRIAAYSFIYAAMNKAGTWIGYSLLADETTGELVVTMANGETASFSDHDATLGA